MGRFDQRSRMRTTVEDGDARCSDDMCQSLSRGMNTFRAHLTDWILSKTSFKANSAARPRSRSSNAFFRCAMSILFGNFRDASRRMSYRLSRVAEGISFMTPVACQPALFRPRRVGVLFEWSPLIYCLAPEGERRSCEGVGLVLDEAEPSRFAEEVRACRRVMFPRDLRICSISCIPSGGLGFFSLINRSR